MKAKIAVATVSGRAYYKLVKELRKKNLSFLSLKPWDPIPLDIKVVLTTKEENKQVSHPQVLLFDNGSNPELVVDRAIMVIQGKKSYEKVVVGVDPGRTCGIALLGDDKVLETLTSSILEEASKLIIDRIKRLPSNLRVVRVGNGPSKYTKELIYSLNEKLPQEVMMEIVSETGTSRIMSKSVNRRGLRDTFSAIEIARRNGKKYSRGNM